MKSNTLYFVSKVLDRPLPLLKEKILVIIDVKNPRRLLLMIIPPTLLSNTTLILKMITMTKMMYLVKTTESAQVTT